jgi:hypothetical protein
MFGTNPFGVPTFGSGPGCDGVPYRAGDIVLEWCEGSSSSSSSSSSSISSSSSSKSSSSSSSSSRSSSSSSFSSSSSSSSLSSSSSFSSTFSSSSSSKSSRSSSSSSSSSSSRSSSSSSISSSSSSTGAYILVADFEQTIAATAYQYTSTSVSTYPIITYRWEVRDLATGNIIAVLESASDTFIYAWPYAGDFSVTLIVTDDHGHTDSETKNYEDQVPIGGGGGAPPAEGISRQKTEEEIKIIIHRVYFVKTKEEVPITIKIYGGVKLE